MYLKNFCGCFVSSYINPRLLQRTRSDEKLIKRAKRRRLLASRLVASRRCNSRNATPHLPRALTKVARNKERACSRNSSKFCFETDTDLSRVLVYPRISFVTPLHRTYAFARYERTVDVSSSLRRGESTAFLQLHESHRRARPRIKIATREIRRTLFYGELYPGDIKYLITRSALKRGNFRYRLSAHGCAQAKGKCASEYSLVIRESRNILQRATVLPGEKGFCGIKIVFMECLKEPEKHFPVALGVS